MAENGTTVGVFEGVHFAVIQAASIDEEVAEELRRRLEANGAEHCPLSSTKLEQVTHLIADTSEFPAYNDAIDAFIHVVRPSWVDASITKKKAINPRQYRPDPSFFLSNDIFAIAEDIPQGDKDALIGGILAMGGQYSPIMSKLVTHVVALSMDNKQCSIATDKRLSCSIMLPHWLNYCLLLGKKIDETPFRLPNAPILEHDDDAVLQYLKDPARKNQSVESIQGASTLKPATLEPTSPSKSRRQLSVFRNHSFLLGEDLGISTNFRNVLQELIEKGGGRVVKRVEDADSVVVSQRRGLNFSEAVENRKDVGCLNWLFHLINTNRWSDPTRKLLHYPPICKPGESNGIRGFQDLKISVSNYTGEARVYLENLVKAAGGIFTKNLTQDNTHLITAHTFSEKVEAARGWEISVVNHLWLEESYAEWTIKSLTNARYTTFPDRTNLGDVVGQTPINRRCVEKAMFPNRDLSPTKAGRIEPLEPRDDNIGSPFNTPIALNKASKGALSKTPATGSDKENATPGSRGAKDRALNKLHLMAPDIQLFNKELKRRGGVIYGGRKVSDPERIKLDKQSVGRKRGSADLEDASTTDEEAEADDAKHTKRRKSAQDPPKLYFMVTGGHKFGWTPEKSKKLRKYGLVELADVSSRRNIDVVVSEKVWKTPKFLAGIAAGAQIVQPGWLDAVLQQKDIVDPEAWTLSHHASEGEYQIDLQQSLHKARAHKISGGLLQGMTIYSTEHIYPSQETYQDLVARNGGKCLPYKGRETKPPQIEEQHNDTEKPLYLLSVPEDQRVWPKFRRMAEENGYKPIVVATDWCLRMCMRQDRSAWEATWELKE